MNIPSVTPSTRDPSKSPAAPVRANNAKERRTMSTTAAPGSVAPPVKWRRPKALLLATRPRQWMKNLLVFAAPGAAGLLGHAAVLERTAMTFAIFLIASAGTYLLNDAMDATADRLHPEKAARPIASGALDRKLALGAAGAFLTLAIGAASYLGGIELGAVLGSYVLINVCYSLGLKRVPVIELACVASGFVLRSVAGGVCVHVPISAWFSIITSGAALLVVAGKRSAEIDLYNRTGVLHRQVLASYSVSYLRTVRMIASSVSIVSFCLWGFQRASVLDVRHSDGSGIFFVLAIIPYVLGVLSVERSIDNGEGGAPENLVLHNRTIQALGFCCLALVAFGIYT